MPNKAFKHYLQSAFRFDHVKLVPEGEEAWSNMHKHADQLQDMVYDTLNTMNPPGCDELRYWNNELDKFVSYIACNGFDDEEVAKKEWDAEEEMKIERMQIIAQAAQKENDAMNARSEIKRISNTEDFYDILCLAQNFTMCQMVKSLTRLTKLLNLRCSPQFLHDDWE